MYRTEYTVLLLKSMALNYPVIKHLGMELGKLLFVLTEPGQMKAAVSLFSDMEAPVISEFTKKSDCKKVIASANSSFVIFPYIQSKASNDYLQFLGSLVRSGSLGSPGLNAIPVVISERLPYGAGMENIFLVSLNGNLESLKKGLISVVPPDNKLEVVFDRIRCNIRENMTPDKKSFIAAACFLYPNMLPEIRVLDFLHIKDHVESLIEFDDNNHDSGGATEAFIHEFYAWHKTVGFAGLYELPYLGTEAMGSLGYSVFFNEKYIFIKNSLFKRIAGNLLGVFCIDLLKNRLADDGVIYKDETSAVVVKMPFYDINGQYGREYMVRFDRGRLEDIAGFDFIDCCQSGKGETEYGIKTS